MSGSDTDSDVVPDLRPPSERRSHSQQEFADSDDRSREAFNSLDLHSEEVEMVVDLSPRAHRLYASQGANPSSRFAQHPIQATTASAQRTLPRHTRLNSSNRPDYGSMSSSSTRHTYVSEDTDYGGVGETDGLLYDSAMNSAHRRNTTDDGLLERDDALSFTVRVGEDDTDEDRYHSSVRSINPVHFTQARAQESTLERRKNAFNTLFGVMPWKSQVRAKTVEERSPELKELLLDADVVAPKRVNVSWDFNVWNIVYVCLFGWILSLVHLVLAGVMCITIVGFPFARLSFKMARFFLWPFGRYVVIFKGQEKLHFESDEEDLLRRKLNDAHESQSLLDGPSAPSVLSYIAIGIWYIFFTLIAVPFQLLVMALCWFLVLFVPMAKVSWRLMFLSYSRPLLFDIEQEYPGAGREVLLCTFKAANFYYYKYQLFGMNIILVNLLPFVLLSIVMGYFLPLGGVHVPPVALTLMSLLSIVPLSYYIGTAISSLSAQLGSFALGAVLNASFGSFIELMVYFAAIYQGGLNSLVQAGVTGSLLGVMLLLPGLSMVFGGIRHKTQRFNPAAAGVSMVLLILSVVGAFIPTIYYNIYGSSTLNCYDCASALPNPMEVVNTTAASCTMCQWVPVAELHTDPIFQNYAKPLSYMVAAILPLAYLVGLLFTLKTHKHIYDMPDSEDDGGGHDAPAWTKLQCVVILVVATVLFGLVSEELVDSLQPTLDAIGLDQAFAGLTIIALIPNTAEIVNAIQFALQNNFALSLEIGNAAATQITLIQMPVLVVIGAIISDGHQNPGFTLIFPLLDLVAVFLAMIIVNYISIEGKSNYFTGSALILVYVLLVSAFYFVPSTDDGSSSSSGDSTSDSGSISSVPGDDGVGQFSMTKQLFDLALRYME
mmetsp:Transcript_16080/g.41282  ORF Transcript_16080/g.41282 Transcript_16080/m.41282 type:complete len:887 (-) Transcript_16080:57-2717(-)